MSAIPECDVITAGFPCQDLSQVGRTKGISGSESSLINEVFRLLVSAPTKVRWLVLENVPFMLRLQRGRAIQEITQSASRLGWQWAYRTVDTRAFGLPQRRRRVILLASRSEDPRPILLGQDIHEIAFPVGKIGFAVSTGRRTSRTWLGRQFNPTTQRWIGTSNTFASCHLVSSKPSNRCPIDRRCGEAARVRCWLDRAGGRRTDRRSMSLALGWQRRQCAGRELACRSTLQRIWLQFRQRSCTVRLRSVARRRHRGVDGRSGQSTVSDWPIAIRSSSLASFLWNIRCIHFHSMRARASFQDWNIAAFVLMAASSVICVHTWKKQGDSRQKRSTRRQPNACPRRVAAITPESWP